MLKKILILFFILLSFVNAEDFSQYTYITTDLKVDGEVELIYLDASSRLDYFETRLNFLPYENVNQEIIKKSFSSDPEAIIDEDENYMRFRWNDRSLEKISYGLNAEIKSKNIF